MKATGTSQDTVTFPVGGQDHPKQKSNKGGRIKRVLISKNFNVCVYYSYEIRKGFNFRIRENLDMIQSL